MFKKYMLTAICIFSVSLFCINSAFSAPDLSGKYFNIGVSYHKSGQYLKAIDSYQKALKLNPKYSNAKLNLSAAYQGIGISQYKKGQYSLAIKSMNKALQLEPKNTDIYYNLGIFYNAASQPEQAIKSYQSALKIDPGYKTIRHNLFVTYYNLGINTQDKNQAISYLKKAVQLDSTDKNVYFALGNAYISQNSYDEAIKAYLKVLEIDPSFDGASNNIKYANRKKEENLLSAKLNSLIPSTRAPQSIYKLVRIEDSGQENLLTAVYNILDLLWNDSESRRLLEVLRSHNTPINIMNSRERSHAETTVRHYNETVYLGGVPAFTYEYDQEKKIAVNIGKNVVEDFTNPNISVYERIYSLHVFIHEFCHADKGLISKKNDNALSEELSASMIGYNIVYRIIRGTGLTENEAKETSKRCLKALLADDHRDLPLYNDFNVKIQKLGINPPFLYEYQDISNVYKEIRNDKEVYRLDKLESMLRN